MDQNLGNILGALTTSTPMLWVITSIAFVSLIYIWVSWAGHKRNADRIIAHNEGLGLPMHYEFGWLGVRIIPIIGKGTPDRSSSAPPKL